MNLKIPNEGLSFFFMTAGIMNPMMVMRILDWVSDTAAPRQHYWPTTDQKKPQEICQLASPGRSDRAGISTGPRVLPYAAADGLQI
jgi:hypothetical protein